MTHTHDTEASPSPGYESPENGDPWQLPRSLAVAMLCATLALVTGAVLFLLPVRYAVLTPGPVYNTLGEIDGHALITISGRETYPTEGDLDLTTVSVFGGPGDRTHLWTVMRGWLDPTEDVLPVDAVFPPGTTAEEEEEQNEAAMVGSQESATAAALTELGIDFRTDITVVDTVEGTAAEGVFEPDDVVLAVDGQPLTEFDQLRDDLQAVTPGDDTTVTVRRDGDTRELTLATSEAEDGSTRLGVIISPTFAFPFSVDIRIDNVGGPSAGTMFALGIIDSLTPGAMTGGEHIAGTGTIDPDGSVGPIGGIVQKVNGARESGAEFFLVPADNCDQLRGHVPEGLTTVSVSSLHEARGAVESIGEGADLSALPSCA